MIEIFIENPNKPVVHKPQYFPSANDLSAKATKMGLTIAEYHRRNHLIAKAAQDCGVHWGMVVRPSSEEDFARLGPCKIIGVVRHIDQYGEVEWNDNPYILSIKPEKEDQSVVNCTHNWVVPYIEEKGC